MHKKSTFAEYSVYLNLKALNKRDAMAYEGIDSRIGKVPKEEWYAMRVAYQQELKAKAFCDKKAIENFIPMKFAEITVRKRTGGNVEGNVASGAIEKRVKKWVPAIHNLIFIKLTGSAIADLKKEMEAQVKKIPLRYIIDNETKKPLIVPESDMDSFMKVAGSKDEGLIYLTAGVDEYPKLVSNDKVRVTGGPYEGAEGYVVRVKKDRRVMVKIAGTCAVLTSFVHPSLLEKIEKS